MIALGEGAPEGGVCGLRKAADRVRFMRMKRTAKCSAAGVAAVLVGIAILAGLTAGRRCEAEQTGRQTQHSAADSTVRALMVSDIHFDPFHDPGKAKRLLAAPESEWAGILASPATAEAGEYAGLQRTCHARGMDTPYSLLRSSLEAMHERDGRPKFITVSGDLVVHDFVCRYRHLLGTKEMPEYGNFVAKTIAFVVGQLREEFPGTPLYVSLGNNDTGCGDYRMDAGDAWLKSVSWLMAEGVPANEQAEVRREFRVGGYYSVPMAGLRRTRLIVLNDLYQSPYYRTCGGKGDPVAASAEMRWLGEQLAQARRAGEQVWVMGHIPPGVNAYTTVRRRMNVCGGQKADMFLHSTRLDELLTQNAGEIRLAIFAHTHMDEMRLIRPEGAGADTAGVLGRSVAMKLVPSISPVDGNNSSFMVAEVDRRTATMRDYQVYEASNHTGVGTRWRKEYAYDQTYHEKAYSAAALGPLVTGFEKDRQGKTAASSAYIRYWYKGQKGEGLRLYWHQYACSLEHMTAKGYAGCVCGTGK